MHLEVIGTKLFGYDKIFLIGIYDCNLPTH